MSIHPDRWVETLGKVARTMRGISSAVQVSTAGRPAMSTQSCWVPSTLTEGMTMIDGGMRPASMAAWSALGEDRPVTRDSGSPTQPWMPSMTL